MLLSSVCYCYYPTVFNSVWTTSWHLLFSVSCTSDSIVSAAKIKSAFTLRYLCNEDLFVQIFRSLLCSLNSALTFLHWERSIFVASRSTVDTGADDERRRWNFHTALSQISRDLHPVLTSWRRKVNPIRTRRNAVVTGMTVRRRRSEDRITRIQPRTSIDHDRNAKRWQAGKQPLVCHATMARTDENWCFAFRWRAFCLDGSWAPPCDCRWRWMMCVWSTVDGTIRLGD